MCHALPGAMVDHDYATGLVRGVLTELTLVFVQVSWGSASFPLCPVKNVPEGI
ncbi:hypothetical protein [Streptomyces ureilyticus]|uniref:hypothetical protein n=1 Tax=Streptomyces ureilyticus TaxID=1775131 RepID=UPI0038B64DC2